MKKRVVLFGKGRMVIDDFFMHANDEFEMQTSSCRPADIISHMEYFQPDVMIYSMLEEDAEVINCFTFLRSEFETREIPLVLVGDGRECEQFQISTGKMAQIILKKPITARGIKDALCDLPVKKRIDKKEEKQVAADQAKQVEQTAQAVQNQRKRILLVDDNVMTLRLIHSHLKDEYAVACASDGETALKFLGGTNPDLIILDYEMPGVDGAQLLEIIRRNEKTTNIPVIFLTGISDRSKIERVVGLKPNAYLLKPIEKAELLQWIAQILS